MFSKQWYVSQNFHASLHSLSKAEQEINKVKNSESYMKELWDSAYVVFPFVPHDVHSVIEIPCHGQGLFH